MRSYSQSTTRIYLSGEVKTEIDPNICPEENGSPNSKRKNYSPMCSEENGSPNSKRKMGSPSPSPTPSPISQCDEVKLDFDIKQSTDVIDMLQHIDDLLDSTNIVFKPLKRQNEARNKSGCKSGNVDECYRYSISSPA